jgi:hypothetical protein
MTTTPLAALQTHATSELRPGEEFLAGIFVHQPQSAHETRNMMFAGVAGGAVLDLLGQKKSQQQLDITIGMTGALVGVTADRVLVFHVGHKLEPKDLIGTLDREGLALDSQEFRKGLVKQWHFTLVAGDRMVLDGVVPHDNDDLESVRALLPAAVRA